MANLKQLKLKRQSVIKTQKVTRAMEAVSAVKMRKSQELALEGRPFASVALRILSALSFDFDSSKHYLVEPAQNPQSIGLVLISSDKGLAGSLNSSILKKAESFIEQNADKKIKAIAIGKKAKEFLQRKGIEILYFRENKKDDVALEDSQDFLDILIKTKKEGDIDAWYIAYMNFISTFEQKPILRQILPLDNKELKSLVEDITPKKGKFAEENPSKQEAEKEVKRSYIFESNSENLLDELLPALVNVELHHALLESKASEHSARMVAMKSATDKAKEVAHSLLLKFNKARQAAITREVSEITSGVEAMKE